MSQRYRRSPFLLLRWEGADLWVLNANRSRAFRGAHRYLELLHRLTEWTTAGELADSLGRPVMDIERTLGRLQAMELVITDPPDPGDVFPDGDGATDWELLDLALQRQTARGGYDPDKPRSRPAPPAFKPAPHGRPLKLEGLELDDAASVRRVLEDRRSVRSYSTDDITVPELDRFLYTTARVTSTVTDPVLGRFSRRPYPSGGARHALEIYPVCNAVSGLDAGAYYYHPNEHSLYLLNPADERMARLNQDVRAATGDIPDRDPPVVLLITAVFQRTMWKYDGIALSTILKDLGALYQTMYLVATAMGLAPCAIGGGRESDNAQWLGLDPLVESQVGAFLLGHPAAR